MKLPTSSTNGEKMKSLCVSNNKKIIRALASKQTEFKKERQKRSEYPAILVFYYRKDKKINSNQLENDQS
ncbi:sperm protein associated with the nucleus on the X chromosome N3-like [Sapajus apella]|uniref:Sperm protein associated with the nucleus on the X chromosome N3-like n=1 Tax=Sapajus apella TaxID=9515 RepID=A0A6J3G2W0_SAPAP|nr:sperm protein associated with the nucleus on the X chromosome N3-like [Sapajus apella]